MIQVSSESLYYVVYFFVISGIPNLMVVTREEPPYVMVKCANCTGNERFEGFAIELLNAISEVIVVKHFMDLYLISNGLGCRVHLQHLCCTR